jgi:hypothetical protein
MQRPCGNDAAGVILIENGELKIENGNTDYMDCAIRVIRLNPPHPRHPRSPNQHLNKSTNQQINNNETILSAFCLHGFSELRRSRPAGVDTGQSIGLYAPQREGGGFYFTGSGVPWDV